MADLFMQIISFNNLYQAFQKSFKGKKQDPEAASFYFKLETNLIRLQADLQDKKYLPGKYRYFKVRDPKERIISVAPFRDRVVHHALVRILEPLFEKKFISNSFACRKEKGSHKAVTLARDYLRSNRYYLKMDVEKYFETMDHQKLLNIIAEKIVDVDIFWLIRAILKTSELSSGIKGKGIPIGNLTSQFFGNTYLDKLDHQIMDVWQVKNYIRYMDDLLVFSDDKGKLKELWRQIEIYLAQELFLKAKKRACFIQGRGNGLGFLGYRVFPGLLRVKNKNIRRLKRKIFCRERQFSNGEISEETMVNSGQSIIGYFRFADTQHLLASIFYPGKGQGRLQPCETGRQLEQQCQECAIP